MFYIYILRLTSKKSKQRETNKHPFHGSFLSKKSEFTCYCLYSEQLRHIPWIRESPEMSRGWLIRVHDPKEWPLISWMLPVWRQWTCLFIFFCTLQRSTLSCNLCSIVLLNTKIFVSYFSIIEIKIDRVYFFHLDMVAHYCDFDPATLVPEIEVKWQARWSLQTSHHADLPTLAILQNTSAAGV